MYKMKEQIIPSHEEAWMGPESVNLSIRRQLTRGNQRVSTTTYPRDQQLPTNMSYLLSWLNGGWEPGIGLEARGERTQSL